MIAFAWESCIPTVGSSHKLEVATHPIKLKERGKQIGLSQGVRRERRLTTIRRFQVCGKVWFAL